MEHPIKPTDDLRTKWLYDDNFPFASGTHDLLTLTKDRLNSIIDKAAEWAADEELEACLDWVSNNDCTWKSDQLRRARRPRPPSLKEKALAILSQPEWSADEEEIIRKALEALPDG